MKKIFPVLNEKLYYTIGEVAKAFDVNASLLRHWEKEFPILKPKKNRKGNRFFTPADIENLKIIYYLVKEKGYTLDGARMALTSKPNTRETISTIERLENIRIELIKLRNLLPENETE